MTPPHSTPRLLLALLVALALTACSGTGDRPNALPADATSDALVAFDASADDAERTDVALAEMVATDAATPPPGDVSQPPDDASRTYPAGPYGTEVGQVLANVAFEGFVNPGGAAPAIDQPYTTTSMAELRGSARGYGLVFVAEFY